MRTFPQVVVTRGSLAIGLSSVDPAQCGSFARPVAAACAAFTEIENWLERSAIKLVELISEPDSLVPPGVRVSGEHEIGEPVDTITPSPDLAQAFAAAEHRNLHGLRTISMLLAENAHRELERLNRVIESKEAGADRLAAEGARDALLNLAETAGLTGDHRHPFRNFWPRLRAVPAARTLVNSSPESDSTQDAPPAFDAGAFDLAGFDNAPQNGVS